MRPGVTESGDQAVLLVSDGRGGTASAGSVGRREQRLRHEDLRAVRVRVATLWGAGLLAAYAVSRTYALLRLPPFLDEALTIVWGRNLWSGGWWNAPSADGKLLSVAIVGAVDALWPTGWPVLLGARLVSVSCGCVALVCCLVVGRRLGGDVAGVVSGVVYLVSPYAVWHDRLCLADSHLAAVTGLVFASSLRLMTSGSLPSAIVLGVALIAAVLTKVTGGLLFVVPLTALLMKPSELSWRPLLRRLAMVYGVSAPVSLWALSRVWWAPRSSQLAKVGPFGAIAHNLEVSADWFRTYWTFPLWILVAVCCIAVVATHQRRAAFLLAGIAAPVAFFAVTARIWWPRYLLVTAVPMAVSVGLVLGHVWDRFGRAARWGLAAAFVLAVVPAIRWDISALRAPQRAELPAVDRYQYIDGWPSGYGSAGLVEALRSLATARGSIVVKSDRTADRVPALVVKATARDIEVIEAKPEEWLAVVQGRPTYALISGEDSATALAAVERVGKRVGRWERPDGRVFAALYELQTGE